jgi:site-specific recombinase XerD
MAESLSSQEGWLFGLKKHLHDEQYRPGYVGLCIAAARNFVAFLHEQNIAITEAQSTTVESYLKTARPKRGWRNRRSTADEQWRRAQKNGIHMLLRMVLGQWPPIPAVATEDELYRQELCEEYAKWLAEMRGLAQETVAERKAEAGRFLRWLGKRVTRQTLVIDIEHVDSYMKSRAESLQRASTKGLAIYLRSFLRWLHTSRRCAQDLSLCVRAPSLYALEGIPSALQPREVTNILSIAKQDHSAIGIRDYAILMLLAEYGLRAGEVASLRLDDVDWRKEVIRIRHRKTGVTSWLPLLPEVGEAILCYLRQARPKTSFREIFIRGIAPYRPFRSGSSLYSRARYRIDAAGISATGKRGPHAFRHARATSLMQASVPLKEIGDLLGHRSADSTLIYLKLATEDLRELALEIPAEVKP